MKAKKKTIRSAKATPRVKRSKTPAGTAGTFEAFDALPDAEKERVYQAYEREVPFAETRPLTPAERRQFARFRRRARGRPRTGRGSKVVAVSLERDLLSASDGFARQRGMKRSELIAAGLRAVMAHPAWLSPTRSGAEI